MWYFADPLWEILFSLYTECVCGGVQDYQALVETVLLVKNTKLVLFSAYGSSFYDIYFGFNVGPLAVDFLSNS